MLNIVIPMAGKGTHYTEYGIKIPKPLFPVGGFIPMAKLVIDNVKPIHLEHRFIFVVLNEHIIHWQIDKWLKFWEADCEIIVLPEVLQGACMSVLSAKKYFNNRDHLMIVNSDQWVDFSPEDYIAEMDIAKIDALVMTTTSNRPNCSFAKLDKKGNVIGFVEKKVVSDKATVGIYNCRNGRDFVKYAEKMIADNFKINGEFYVCPVFDYMTRNGLKVGIKTYKEVHFFGTALEAGKFSGGGYYGFDFDNTSDL